MDGYETRTAEGAAPFHHDRAGWDGDAPGSRHDDLMELHREGRLASEFPRIRELLVDAPSADLARAGQLLARLEPDDVLRAHPGTPIVNIAITGHGTLAMLRTTLTAELARHGVLMRPFLSDFDGYVFDLGDPGSALYATDADLVLCLLDPMIVFDEVPTPWRPADVERVLGEKVRLVERLAATCATTARGSLVINTMPLLRRFTAQLVDQRSRARLGAVWREANARLLRLPEEYPALTTVDLDPLLAEAVAASDVRMSLYAKAHLSADLLAAYAREVGHMVRHVLGMSSKVLALDLDGTLWGGVLGDDGVAGIEVGGTRRGEAFQAFQRVVKQIGAQGVLVTAVSKNDEEPVTEALRDHPRMVLREDDFVRVVANWRPKPANLSDLAGALGLGVDSVVFADDSPYECDLVRQALPAVAVVALDDEPARHVERLLHDGWFNVPELTEEDEVRPARYREDVERQSFLDSFESLDDYLRGLDVRVRLALASEADVPRVSQITLRTNQFNMTTERLQVADVRRRMEDPDALVLAIHASDRFGDHGLVGVVFVRLDGSDAHIDNFLLSCRVFSRGIEKACLVRVLCHVRAAGARTATGVHRATAKNGKVKDFYVRNGFRELADDGTSTAYRHDLVGIAAPPEHVTVTDELGDPS